MNKRGFTLMELMVYMAIVGIVVVIAGQVYSDSTKMRIRTQGMIEASEIAENVGNLLRDDVSQMGAKSAIDAASSTAQSDAFVEKNNLVYMNVDPTATLDSSSFSYVKDANGAGRDNFTFRRIRYNEDGSFARVEQVSWFLSDNGVLYRSCKIVGNTLEDCPDETLVEMAQGVEKFVATPAKPNVTRSSELLFPINSDADDKSFRLISYYNGDYFARVNVFPAQGGSSVALTGFAENFNNGGSVPTNPRKNVVYVADITTTSDSRDACKKFIIKKDSVYEVSFSLVSNEDASRMFRPGIDHMAIGIRRTSGAEPRMFDDAKDFIFYPPQSADGSKKHTIRFSSSVAAATGTEACLAFTFVFYSPTVSMGRVTIRDLLVKRYSQEFDFVTGYVPTVNEKKSVRGIQFEIVVKKNKESGSSTVVVPIPGNGVNG